MKFKICGAESANSVYIVDETAELRHTSHLTVLHECENEDDTRACDSYLNIIALPEDRKHFFISERRFIMKGVWKYTWSKRGEHVRWTSAPPSYDGFGTYRDGECKRIYRVTFYRVYIHDQHLNWQEMRYASGLYGSFTEEKIRREEEYYNQKEKKDA